MKRLKSSTAFSTVGAFDIDMTESQMSELAKQQLQNLQ